MMAGSLYTDFPNSARKCRTLINQICSYANAEGLTNIPNPAVIKGALEYKLSHLKVRETGNFPSLPFDLLTDFFKHLQTIDSIGARALEFAILTVSRQGQIIKSVRNGVMYGARWSDIDLERGIWFVPAEIVKTKKPFECYLSSYAIKLLNDLPRFGGCPWVFSANGNEPLSNGALLQTIKRMNEQRRKEKKPLWVDPDIKDKYGEPRGVTAHGTARSCFKSWSVSNGNDKRFNEQAVEINMTHKLDDGYSGAYNRAKHEKARREIMEAWGRFCYTGKYPNEE